MFKTDKNDTLQQGVQFVHYCIDSYIDMFSEGQSDPYGPKLGM